MTRDLPGLDAAQRELVAAWCGPVTLVADHSRGSTGVTVLRLRAADGTDGTDVALKASGPADLRLAPEITAHESLLAPLVPGGRVPRLLHADRERHLLATAWLAGEPVEGTAAEHDPATYRQAGELLARLHALGTRVDGDWEAAQDARAMRWLDGPHGLGARLEERLRAVLASHAHPPVLVVPTHGDVGPRSWVLGDGVVRFVGFGRAGWRAPCTDLVRLDRRLEGRTDLVAAFVAGYGADPRCGDVWRRAVVREAIGTAVRAYQAGDAAVEAHGRHLVDLALAQAA
ncbi:aminoglycoside phosphotransferase family protein [Isoptericola sp. S6320L]|uniref:phosphotransferase n=1 Tax=Isoptericola sp. S6320L TaxID=2926411 RepID=UPI001FF37C29|nr:phosphotransferase [Isoptericola sp. S6320L]MCK0115452.1 aminoglycoside phosphotransferase family protein [Isoptericola sp. S6320L]